MKGHPASVRTSAPRATWSALSHLKERSRNMGHSQGVGRGQGIEDAVGCKATVGRSWGEIQEKFAVFWTPCGPPVQSSLSYDRRQFWQHGSEHFEGRRRDSSENIQAQNVTLGKVQARGPTIARTANERET